jgi:NAD(P)-dependent dehydrogenase (short-subunit alcohol dehydrogenase family)
MTWSPQRILVTGASSGIGRACAVALAGQGRSVAIAYRANLDGAARTAELVRAAGAKAILFMIDCADPELTVAACRDTFQALNGIDVLVNNAGVNPRASCLDEGIEALREVLTINALTPIACAGAAAREMVEQGTGGRIINITSVHEHIPLPGGTGYCAAKAALGSATKTMALELAGHHITVNSVAPGEIATGLNGIPEHLDARDIDRPAIPAKRPGSPAEVAAVVAYLASPQASYTTGHSVVVDGGLMLTAAAPNAALAGTY